MISKRSLLTAAAWAGLLSICGGAEKPAQPDDAVRQLLAHPLTADSAARIALLNNQSLQARFQSLGVSYGDYIDASLPENPSLAASWRFPGSPTGAADIEYSVAGDLLNLLMLPVRRKIAAGEYQAARLRVSADVLGLVAETKKAFYDVQARRQLLGRLQLTAEAAEASADLANRQHDAGNITDLDLAEQAAESAQARVETGQMQEQIRAARERLNRLMGLWGAQTGWQCADELPPIPAREISPARLEEKALAQRVDLAAQRQEVANIGAALSLKNNMRFIPILTVGVDTERGTDGQRVTGPTLDLDLPIFNFGQGAMLRLRSQYAEAQRDLAAMEINARSEVREARGLVAASRELAEDYRATLLPQRQAVLKQSLLQYNAMQLGPRDLLAAKDRELDAERAYIQTCRDYWIARVELEQALHGGVSGMDGSDDTMNEPRAEAATPPHAQLP